MRLGRIKAEILTELLERHRWCDAVLERFAKSQSRDDRVRCSEVAQHVADKMGLALSWPLRRRVREAAKMAGFTAVVRPRNVPHYCGMVRR